MATYKISGTNPGNIMQHSLYLLSSVVLSYPQNNSIYHFIPFIIFCESPLPSVVKNDSLSSSLILIFRKMDYSLISDMVRHILKCNTKYCFCTSNLYDTIKNTLHNAIMKAIPIIESTFFVTQKAALSKITIIIIGCISCFLPLNDY